MNELRRRLKDVVVHDYGGSAREASKAAGVNPNLIGQILSNPRQMPSVLTLRQFAETFHWPLGEVVYWALGLEPPARPTDPVEAIGELLVSAGCSEGERAFILGLVRRALPERALHPNNASS